MYKFIVYGCHCATTAFRAKNNLQQHWNATHHNITLSIFGVAVLGPVGCFYRPVDSSLAHFPHTCRRVWSSLEIHKGILMQLKKQPTCHEVGCRYHLRYMKVRFANFRCNQKPMKCLNGRLVVGNTNIKPIISVIKPGVIKNNAPIKIHTPSTISLAGT